MLCSAQRMNCIASAVFGNSLERASVMIMVMVWPLRSLSSTGQSWLRCRGCAWQL